MVFTECDQWCPRVQSAPLAEGRALGNSEHKRLEQGLAGGGGIHKLDALRGNAKV